jgi:hypothetical protein
MLQEDYPQQGERMSDLSSVPNEHSALLDRSMKWLLVGELETRWIRWAFVLAAALYFICLAIFETGPINAYGNDALVLLDGGWRLLNGQVPYRDFYLALGPLEYMITAGGMALSQSSPQGIAIGNVAFGITVGVWGWLISRRRMPSVPALIVTAWLILTATSPTPLGSSWNVISCAMIYNRHGYALLGVVLVECAFASERNRFWDGVSIGIALSLLAFLKLNFFGAAFLLLLATIPLKRNEMRRVWGILAGASCTAAAFCLYLRFAISAFLSDMLFVTQARGASLKVQGIIGDIAGSAEMVTLAIMTIVATLLISPGKLRLRHGVRLILLGCIVIVTADLLRRTNTAETQFQLATLWTAVLLGRLTMAYPRSKEKTAIAAVIALSLGGIAAQFFADAESLKTLLGYSSPSIRSMGANIAGNGMERLKFYDLEDANGPSSIDSNRFYAACVNDGLALLARSSTPQESVLTLGFHNPFSYLLRRKPALGGSPIFIFGYTISRTRLLDANRVFGNADLIMTPHYPSSHQGSDADIEEAYGSYLSQHFTFVASTEWWSLYRRNK